MLTGATLVAFGATANAAAATAFYTRVLGLTLRYEDEFAIALDSDGVELRLQKVERFTPQPFTTLGWQVPRMTEVIERLRQHGVTLERYPWLEQDASGVWQAPSGARVAWFKDPDGNLLSVAEYAAG
jgi:catechol 2,3-dioxygenase-like lactoylglutathione lyase family enzyme